MVTRLYPLVVAPPVSPAFAAGWNDTASAVRRMISASVQPPSSADGTPFAETLSAAEAVATSPLDVLIAQYVSEPLSGAQTISGTLKGQLRALEANLDADYRAQLLAKVVSGDGATLRGTLLGFDTAVLSSEFATALTNRKFPRGGVQTLTSVAASDGDRIVIEVGYRSHNTHTTSRAGSVDNREKTTGATDLAEDETTTTANVPWLEISATLTFSTINERRDTQVALQPVAQAPTPRRAVSQAALEAVAQAPAPLRRVSQVVLQVVVDEYWYGWGVPLELGDPD